MQAVVRPSGTQQINMLNMPPILLLRRVTGRPGLRSYLLMRLENSLDIVQAGSVSCVRCPPGPPRAAASKELRAFIVRVIISINWCTSIQILNRQLPLLGNVKILIKAQSCHPFVEATVKTQKERKRRGIKVEEPMQRQSVMWFLITIIIICLGRSNSRDSL